MDAVLWFAENVFPQLLKKYPDMVWHIVGSKVPEEVLKLASDSIVLEGHLSDEDLEKLYNSCRLVVAPLRYGAGIKGKIIEAAHYQIPVVTTSVGGEGIDASINSFAIADSEEEMIEAISSLYEDFKKLSEMSNNGKKLIDKYYNSNAACEVLSQDL